MGAPKQVRVKDVFVEEEIHTQLYEEHSPSSSSDQEDYTLETEEPPSSFWQRLIKTLEV